jgi:hypothetical protein
MTTGAQPGRQRASRRLLRRVTRAWARRWVPRVRLRLVIVVALLTPGVFGLLLVQGRTALALLLMAGSLSAVGAEILAVRRCRHRGSAAWAGIEQAVVQVYDDWIRAEASRGHDEVERWLGTSHP